MTPTGESAVVDEAKRTGTETGADGKPTEGRGGDGVSETLTDSTTPGCAMEDDTGADETGAVAPIDTTVPSVPPTSPCPDVDIGVPEPAYENYPLMLHSLLRLPFGVTFDHKSASALSAVSMSKKPGVAVYNYSMEQRWRSAGHPERGGGDHGCDERNSQNFGERAALAQAQVGQGCQSGKAEVGWLQPRPASRWPVFFKAAIFQPAAAYCYYYPKKRASYGLFLVTFSRAPAYLPTRHDFSSRVF